MTVNWRKYKKLGEMLKEQLARNSSLLEQAERFEKELHDYQASVHKDLIELQEKRLMEKRLMEHPAGELIRQNVPFVAYREDAPGFMDAFRTLRAGEKRAGWWNDEKEASFQAALQRFADRAPVLER
jgi:hypothetical protein